jgi:hypothetical protein
MDDYNPPPLLTEEDKMTSENKTICYTNHGDKIYCDNNEYEIKILPPSTDGDNIVTRDFTLIRQRNFFIYQ